MRNAYSLEEYFGEIRAAYEDDLIPMTEIASWFHVSRQAIHKVLRKHGIDTSKRKLPVKCFACSKTFLRVRCQIRASKHHFCSEDCFHAWLKAGNCDGEYKQNRHGQRIARRIVGEYFDLQPGNIVHHENRDCLDNRLCNLMVFRDQGDHVRYHRDCGDIVPLWDGRGGVSYSSYPARLNGVLKIMHM